MNEVIKIRQADALDSFRYSDGELYRIMKSGKIKEINKNVKADYLRIYFNGSLVLVHRIIYVMHNGPIKYSMVIDHIDGDTRNNRISNLREVSLNINALNRKRARGTWQVEGSNKWRSAIRINGKRINLGNHMTEKIAHDKYIETKKLHGLPI